MNELEFVAEIFLSVWQQQRQPGSVSFQTPAKITFAIARAPHRSQHVILHALPGKYVRPENKDLAATEPFGPRAHNFVSFPLVDRVCEGMCSQRALFCGRRREAGPVHSDAAEMNQ